MSTPPPISSFELCWPPTVDETAVASSFSALAAEAAPGPLVLEARGEGGSVRHYLRVRRARSNLTTRRFQADLDGLRFDLLGSDTPEPAYNRALKLQLSTRQRPVRTDAARVISASILTALSGTRRGETLTLQWLLGPRLRAMAIPSNLDDFGTDSFLASVLVAPFRGPSKVDPERRRALADKQGQAGWRVLGRLAVRASTPERERQLLHELLAALRVAESPSLKIEATPTNPRRMYQLGEPWRWPSVLNASELLALSGWPLGDVARQPVQRSRYSLLPIPATVPRTGRIVGDGTAPSTERPAAIRAADVTRHTWLLGPSGSGKSNLLQSCLLQDLEAGRAAVLVDSKGDLVNDVLRRIPEHRRRDVVVLDASDDVRPVGLNPLAGPASSANLRADQLLGVFTSLYGDALGFRSADILQSCLLTLARHGDMTLVALPLLLSNPAFRQRLTNGLDDPLGVGSFWQWYESVSAAEQQNATAPILNKVRPFLTRPSLRAVLGQATPTFSIEQVFAEKKVLLVNLAKGTLGPETAQLFGALVFNQLWQTIQGRVRVPTEKRHPVSIYLDEFQDYLRLPQDFSDMLVQARGLGAGLTLAHQHLGQLPQEVKSALLANAGSRVVFRLTHDDAAVMTRGLARPTIRDFEGLPDYHVYASLLAGGERTPFMSLKTRPPVEPTCLAGEIAGLSRAAWGQDAATTEAALRALVSPPVAATSAGGIGRKTRGART